MSQEKLKNKVQYAHYPIEYIKALENEMPRIKEEIDCGKIPVFKNIDDLMKSLEETN